MDFSWPDNWFKTIRGKKFLFNKKRVLRGGILMINLVKLLSIIYDDAKLTKSLPL